MTFPILFPQYAKSSMASSTKYLKKLKLVCGGNAEFHCLDGKRFAEKLDRYITTIVFKDGRRCKCII